MNGSQDTGLVAIGRNEGERLQRCLESAVCQAPFVVYVDSGSTDGSLEMARGLGATIVELDTTQPFTAARARNAGFAALEAAARAAATDLLFVQFVDGDCELDGAWMRRARDVMDSEPDVVVVCGRRAERFPEATVYNLLCDMEWDTPIGDALACGGDALMRAKAFRAVGGFRDDLIAGEEPELCGRLRREGGRVLRIDAPMTLHDARIDSLSQWWMRNVRAGYAYAENAAGLTGPPREDAGGTVRSNLLWGLLFPVAIFVSALISLPVAMGLLLLYPIQIVRIALSRPCPRFSDADNWRNAFFLVIGKTPNVQGQLRYWRSRLTGRRSALIEYKGPEAEGGAASESKAAQRPAPGGGSA